MYSVVRRLQTFGWALGFTAAAAACCGCRTVPGPATGWLGVTAQRATPNLVLAPDADTNAFAAELDRSSDWPSADLGYRFDDVSSYSEILVDNQIAYDRYGSVFRSSQNFRTGVLVR